MGKGWVGAGRGPLWPLQDGWFRKFMLCLLEGICPQLLKTLLYLTKLAAPKGSTSEGPPELSFTPPLSPTSLPMEPPHSQVVKAPSGMSRQSGLLLAFQAREVVTTHAESCQARPFRLNLRKGFYSFEKRRNTSNAIFKKPSKIYFYHQWLHHMATEEVA